jgi:basic amino acid/polyamine antiporter, APA family
MGLGVIAGMLAVFLIVFNALVRVLAFVAKDGLLPAFFKDDKGFGKSVGGTLFCTFVCALLAGTMKYGVVAQACSIGSLGDYTIAAILVMLFRARYPNVARSFKCPFIYLVGAAGTLVSAYLLYKQIAESDRAVGMVTLYWILGFCAFYWIYALPRGKYLKESRNAQKG